MGTYRCWDHENGDEGSAKDIEAPEAEYAAELYGEKINNHSGDWREEFTIRVRDEEDTLTQWTVSVQMEPRYCASEVDICAACGSELSPGGMCSDGECGNAREAGWLNHESLDGGEE